MGLALRLAQIQPKALTAPRATPLPSPVTLVSVPSTQIPTSALSTSFVCWIELARILRKYARRATRPPPVKVILADSDKISFLGQDMFFLGQAELIWGINF